MQEFSLGPRQILYFYLILQLVVDNNIFETLFKKYNLITRCSYQPYGEVYQHFVLRDEEHDQFAPIHIKLYEIH